MLLTLSKLKTLSLILFGKAFFISSVFATTIFAQKDIELRYVSSSSLYEVYQDGKKKIGLPVESDRDILNIKKYLDNLDVKLSFDAILQMKEKLKSNSGRATCFGMYA